ncbi:amidohydrolase family protein [Gordonia jinhuaensis]|nr:amidohydrolase [Gordonia jinhuaensis]
MVQPTDIDVWIADHVVTMNPGHEILSPGAVAVGGQRILAVGSPEEVVAGAGGSARMRRLDDRVLMPGLVNALHHSGMLRGTAEHLPVWEWLRLHIDPMHRVLAPEDAEAAAWMCYAEGLLSGTTTVVDMWRYMDGAARAAAELGNRLVAVNYVGTAPGYDYFDSLDDNERILTEWSGAAGGRIVPWVGLEHPFYADAAGMRRAVAMARDFGTGFYTHCSEGRDEVAEFDARYGAKPLFALEKLGVLDLPRVMLAHAVWLDDDEIELAAERGVSVSHNPVSNMKLASGMAPVDEFLSAGMNVGLGTDGEKENNNLDMFEEMKAASLLGKLRTMDAAAMDSWTVLEMATIGGARALGLADEIGSLEAGKQADFIAVDTRTPLISDGPYANIHHNLVHAVRGSDVTTSVIAGQVVVENGRLVNADLDELIGRVRDLVPDLFRRRSDYLAAAETLPGAVSAL